ncbi:LITAF-like zinc ribbon domain-containing protein [Phyllosticta citricarpa]|uniref:LITAF-like zinc ribbon domain-containing protein n=2 Tax=Phyllosticta TaxID=121621 RepID=A0ABR1MNU2_9PEZI
MTDVKTGEKPSSMELPTYSKSDPQSESSRSPVMTPDYTGQTMPMSQIQPDHQNFAHQAYTDPNAGFAGQTPVGGEQQYRTATPLANLQRSPAPVDCPACGTRALTVTKFKTGNTTHAWAFGVCICVCLGCIPYLVKGTKDVEHRCGKCSKLLATWHRSGNTEVLAHA